MGQGQPGDCSESFGEMAEERLVGNVWITWWVQSPLVPLSLHCHPLSSHTVLPLSLP